MKKVFVSAILAICSLCLAGAQETVQEPDAHAYRVQKRYNIFFRINSSVIEKDFHGNDHTLEQMRQDIDTTLAHDGAVPDSLLILSTASPDGSYAFNKRLSEARAASTEKLLLEMFPGFKDAKIKVQYLEEDWDGLRQVLRQHPEFPQREQMLAIIDNNSGIEDKEKALRACKQGWRYLVNNYIYALRNSSITISVIGPPDEFTRAEPVIPVEPYIYIPKYEVPQTPLPPYRSEHQEEWNPSYLAVKTNMLYDAALVPNVGLEFYLGKNISVAGNWMYAWWHSDKIAWYWRTYGGDLALRYWFGKEADKKPLQGHHVGLYGQIVTYDFQVGARGYLADRWTYGGGIEYGYSLPISRRLNIDFTVGAGYLQGETKEYLPIDGHHVWQVTKYRHWVGPTKAEISLVWLLGRGNINQGKGGKK